MRFFTVFALVIISFQLSSQVVINEGSNRNYQSIADENGDYPDWIEIFNSGQDTINMFNYSLTDNQTNPVKWTFPPIKLNPGEYKTIFCSGKDRKPITSFSVVLNTGTFTPATGWNTHYLTTPFLLGWDI